MVDIKLMSVKNLLGKFDVKRDYSLLTAVKLNMEISLLLGEHLDFLDQL